MLEIAVLVSAGLHPVSGRSRRAPNDGQALELALALAERVGARLRVMYAGDPEEPSLRAYLGMGTPALHVVPVADGIDIVPPLADVLGRWQPDLILTGVRAEADWSSGCLPYLLAETLGYALGANIGAVAAVNQEEAVAELHQVRPRGHRRVLRARLPLVITVDPAAPAPRQSAFARARRGRIIIEPYATASLARPSPGEARPARRRPRRRLTPAAGASAGERLQALTQSAGGGQVLDTGDAVDSAHAIYTYLIENGLLPPRGVQRPAHAPAAEGGNAE
jgi:electron transfer flavoprotein beta subunit